MTRFNLPLKAAATLGILALTATAPSAFAADGAYAKASKQVVNKVQSQRADRGNRNAYRADRGARSDRRDRGTRSNRHERSRSNRNERRRSNRHERSRHDWRDDRRSNRHRQRDYVNLRDVRRRTSDFGHRSRGYRNGYRQASYNNYRRGHGFRHNGYRSNYRSGLGISFSFGSPGFSSYRWAPSNYGFYRPGRISYASYRNQTRCDRVIVDGFQYGTLRPVSVTQCYNPWDGYYIVQGSERIAYNAW